MVVMWMVMEAMIIISVDGDDDGADNDDVHDDGVHDSDSDDIRLYNLKVDL
jgi:hypothetical protein